MPDSNDPLKNRIIRIIDSSLISNISTFTYNAILTGPSSFKWFPKQYMTGEADVKFDCTENKLS